MKPITKRLSGRALRRIEARAQKRQPPAKAHTIDPALAWLAQQLAIVKSSDDPLGEGARQEFMTAVYLRLEKLRVGNLTEDDFFHVIGMNAVAGEIAYQLQFHDPSGQITTAGHACMAAAEALADMGTRYGQTGRFVATGDEFRLLREATQYLDELLSLAPVGVITAAMTKTSRQMDHKLPGTGSLLPVGAVLGLRASDATPSRLAPREIKERRIAA